MPKVYVEHHQQCMEEVFEDIGWQVTRDMDKADALVLIGGVDIDTSWYNAPKHPRTGGSLIRDEITDKLYLQAVDMGIPILGVCRGAQFINARVGGGMYQDVNYHTGGRHRVYDEVTKCYHTVNSIHHQMMIPTDRAVCVAKAVEAYSDTPICSYREIAVIDPEDVTERVQIVDIPVSAEAPEWEVLYYPEVKGLCFQAHPEYDQFKGPCRQYFYELLSRYFPELDARC